MKIEVIEVRKGVLDVNPDHYEKGSTAEDILRIEQESQAENYEYMDLLDATSEVTFKVIDGDKL